MLYILVCFFPERYFKIVLSVGGWGGGGGGGGGAI